MGLNLDQLLEDASQGCPLMDRWLVSHLEKRSKSLVSPGHNWWSGLWAGTTWDLGRTSPAWTQLRLSGTPGGQSGSGLFLILVGKRALVSVSDTGPERWAQGWTQLRWVGVWEQESVLTDRELKEKRGVEK